MTGFAGLLTGADAQRSSDLGVPVMSLGSWTSVYLPNLPDVDTLIRLCQAAGVHLYLETGDVVYADQSFLCLHAQTAGVKHIRLPQPGPLYDLDSGRELVMDGTVATLEMAAKQTTLLFRGSAEAWERLKG